MMWIDFFRISETMIFIASFIAGFLAIRYFRQTKNHVFYLFAMDWFFWGLSWFFIALSQYTYNPIYLQLSFIPQFIAVLYLVAFVDHTRGEQMSAEKAVIVTAIGVIQIIGAWMPGSISIVDGVGVLLQNYQLFIQALFICLYCTVFLDCMVRTWIHAPIELKKSARLFLISTILITVIPGVLYLFIHVNYFFAIIGFFIHALGIILLINQIDKEPRLMYIIPFVAHRLIIINRESGLLGYEYRWSNFELDQSILSGLIQALQVFSMEMLRIGDIQEMKLKDGVIMMEHGKYYSFALIVSKSAIYLRDCLQDFKFAFELEAEAKGLTDEEYLDYEQFKFGKNLITKFFNNISKREIKTTIAEEQILENIGNDKPIKPIVI